MQAGLRSPIGKAFVVAIALVALSGSTKPKVDSKATQLSAILAEAAKDAQGTHDYKSAIRHYDKLYAREKNN